MIRVKKSISKLLLVLYFVAMLFTTIPPAQAATGDSCQLGSSVLGIPTWYKYLEGAEDERGKCAIDLEGRAGSRQSARSGLLIGIAVLEIMITLAGLVAVVMIFIGSFKYILTQGESEKAAGARKTVINALIGLVIIIIATRVVSFIGGTLG
jgi:hypothetical protein